MIFSKLEQNIARTGIRALRDLHPATRSFFLNISCNTGSATVRNVFENARPDSDGKIDLPAVPVKDQINRLSDYEVEDLWLDAASQWLQSKSEPESCDQMLITGPNPIKDIPLRTSEGQVHAYLPWQKQTGLRLPGTGAIGSSTRTFEYFDQGKHYQIKIDNSSRAGGINSIRQLAMAIKGAVVNGVFEVDYTHDAQSISAIDILHCAYMDSRIRLAREKNLPVTVIPEQIFSLDGSGRGLIVRCISDDFLYSDLEVAAPLFCFVGERRRKSNCLLNCVSRHYGVPDWQLALVLSVGYLRTFFILMFKEELICTVPHAQNCLVALGADLGDVRVAYKDLRDVEHWSHYASASSLSARLCTVEKNYLAYQMTAHPIYYDTQIRPRGITTPCMLAEAVFNYSFAMLLNHVVRGFELAMSSQDHAAIYRSKINSVFCALADGENDVPELKDLLLAPKIHGFSTSRGALRSLRARWLYNLSEKYDFSV